MKSPEIYKVEGENGAKEDFSEEKKPEAEKTEITAEELEAYTKKAQTFIDRYSKTGFFAQFSGDSAIRFKLSNGFYFDMDRGEVNLDTKWFFERGFSERQILWACMHEIAHFEDLKSDPDRLMQNFGYIRDQARKTGSDILLKWKEVLNLDDPEQRIFFDSIQEESPVDPTKPERGTMNRLSGSAYEIHHAFFNCMDDIWVNNHVSRKSPSFEKGTRGGKDVEGLYREKLFPGTDYSTNSRHRQFMYALLRKDNVPDEECTLAPDVIEALGRGVQFAGKTYTSQEIIDTFVKPRTGRDTKAGERYTVLKRTLEPLFLELLEKDLKDWEPKWPPPEGGQGGGGEKENGKGTGDGQSSAPFEGEIKEWKDKNIDQLPPETKDAVIKKQVEVVEKKKKEKKEREAEEEKIKAEEKKTAKERAKEAQDRQDTAWAKENAREGKSAQELIESLKKFREVEEEVRPYLEELSTLWRRIVYGTSRTASVVREGHYKTGDELDIPKVVSEWSDIQKGKFENVHVFRRPETREKVTNMPELIRVRLLGDMSLSMQNDGGEKMRTLQQAMVLIISSLNEFNTYLNATRRETKTKLRAETECWTFGDSAEKIKGFEDGDNIESVSIFSHLENPSGGYTNSHIALNAILSSMSEAEQALMQAGKIMDIVFEITDGGSSLAEASRVAVDELSKKGSIARGFQIGRTKVGERIAFDSIWNKDVPEKRGEIIGTDISRLVPAIIRALKKYLGDVRL